MNTQAIESDDKCFFRALSHQLTGHQDGHMVLRQLIADYMSINREIYETAVDKQHFRCWNDFIWQMRLSRTFADDTTVAALVMSLRRDIVVHQRGQGPLIFKSSMPGPNNRQIHLAYDTLTLHYQALSSVASNELYIDEAECISA
jgi:CRISPR/Cas system CMR subunit Cmr6 (Cas7 group RAMP superfamily)